MVLGLALQWHEVAAEQQPQRKGHPTTAAAKGQEAAAAGAHLHVEQVVGLLAIPSEQRRRRLRLFRLQAITTCRRAGGWA